MINVKFETAIKILDELNLAEVKITEALRSESDTLKRARIFTIVKLSEKELKDLEGVQGL